MFIFTYAAAFLAIIFAVSAAALFFWKRDDTIVVLFVAYLLTGALWIGGNATADVSYTTHILILTSEIAYLGGILNLFCFLLIVDFLVNKSMPSRTRMLVYIFPTAALCILGFTPLAIEGVGFPINQPAQIVPGIVYSITLWAYMIVFAYGAVRVYHGVLRETEYTRRMQLLYVLVGLLVTVSGQLFFDLLLPLLGELRFFTLGPITSLFFALCCGYAITKHKLIDIRLVIQRSAIYTLLAATIILCYLILVNSVGLLVDGKGKDILLSAGITTLIGIFGAPVIERTFRKASDWIFFKDHYDYARVIHELSEILYTNIALSEIIQKTEYSLATNLRASWVRIVLSETTETATLPALTVPITLERNEVARILFGEKLSGDPYTKEDKQLLTTFAYQTATSFSRARLYEETKHYAESLAQKVEERTEELRTVQEGQRQMMVDISHNLQTPLALFQTKVERLKREFPNDTEILNFERSIASLSTFIYDLLSLATLEQIEKESFELFSITTMLEDIVEEVTVIATNVNIQMEVALGKEILYRGNEKRLREAIMNLTSNAMKYIGENGEKKIMISLSQKLGSVILQIADTGIGIPEIDTTRIFEQFYRSSNAPLESHGTGLGLAIVKRIIDSHKGSIVAESTVGKGTTFTITLPA